MYNNFSNKNDKRFFPKNNCNSNQKITKKSCYNHMNQEETICPRGPGPTGMRGQLDQQKHS